MTDDHEHLRRDRRRRRPQRADRGGVPRPRRPAGPRPRGARPSSAARRSPRSSRPASACRRWPTPSAGCARRSSESSTWRAYGLVPRRARGPRLRPAARRPRGDAVGRPGQERRVAARLVRRRRHRVRRVRPPRPLAVEVPRGHRRRGPARHQGPRRSATRSWACASAARSAAWAATTAGRSCGSSRWRSRTSWPSRSTTEAIRATIAWRGVRYTAMGPWSAGSTSVLLADAAGNDGGGRGRDGVRQGRPVRRVRGAGVGCPRPPAPRSAPARRWSHVTTADGAVTGVALESGEEIAAPAVVSGLDPKQLLTTLVDPVTVGPTMRWRAGNIRTPGRVGQGQPRPGRAAGVPGRRRRRAAAPRPDPGRHDLDRRDGARLRRVEVRAVSPSRRCSRRRSRRSWTRRWWPARPRARR